ncbi:hypothetical protein MFS40622_0402 [Methanocaldococcus sp. FS406-22]|uniref:glycosyltransferase family 9 protein n=1 Tax=Methanocaldococcus sp. (strain FS406-22) TaxID=644281 RepID=UPI0001BF106F|nr:hypothetical protein [Methanocaldococcus sp. FS406-22]ADC69097.1 hypothetical protein MFS40622_0402 [Methanocaldococcus sp. FS406-22]
MNKKLLYFLLKLSILISNISYNILFKKRRLNIDLTKTLILFNRTDRIGDAIVTLPFFLALKNKGIKFKVLCSPYNKWVLEPFVEIEEIKDFKFSDFEFSIKSLLFNILSSIATYLKNLFIEKNKNITFVDLKGDFHLSERFKNYYQIHFKSFLLNLKYSDYVFNDFYVFGSKMQLIEKYSMIFDNLEDIEEFPKELKEYIINNHNKEIDTLINSLKDFIIIFVGNKEFRNLNIEQWKYLIENINYEGKIVVIDDPSQNYLKRLKSIIKKENVIFLEKVYDLWSLMYLAMHSKLVIGVDGGGFNFLQLPTNAFEIILYTNEKVWRPFSKNEYQIIRKDRKHIIEKSITSQNLKKYIYYIDWDYKVVYEILQEKNNDFVDKIRVDLIVEEINKILFEV